MLPGGFSYGDDVGAGRRCRRMFMQHFLTDAALRKFRDEEKLILSICNRLPGDAEGGSSCRVGREGRTVGDTGAQRLQALRGSLGASPSRASNRVSVLEGNRAAFTSPSEHGEEVRVPPERVDRERDSNKRVKSCCSLRRCERPPRRLPGGTPASQDDIAGICEHATGLAAQGLCRTPTGTCSRHHEPAMESPRVESRRRWAANLQERCGVFQEGLI